MDVSQINQHLLNGEIGHPGVLPRVEALHKQPYQFKHEFGLDRLPMQPGIIIIRGPRQYGKSTWLEKNIAETITEFGAGSALYLNGDEIKDWSHLRTAITELIPLFSPQAAVKRLFIDEMSAVQEWEKAIKRLSDEGVLQDILVITTGSKATDLLRGTERLPGRKGKLSRTNYIFTPISYREFKSQCGALLGEDTLFTYLLSGGSPIAANELVTEGQLPDYIKAQIRDWILGEFAASGRTRTYLLGVLQVLYRFMGNPVGQAKLARESGLLYNTTAQGYMTLLQDLMCVLPAFSFDHNTKLPSWRKPCKYHFTNLLMAMVFHPQNPRSVQDLKALTLEDGALLEWAVAQELFRRQCIANAFEVPEYLLFWQSKTNELDFVVDNMHYIEVKRGKESPIDYTWFTKTHPKSELMVINQNRFEAKNIHGITLEDFLEQF